MITSIMEKVETKTLSKPDERRTFDKGVLDLVTVNGVTFGRTTFQPGWRWSTSLKSVVKTESCEAAHLNYHISGRLHVRMDDGEEFEFGPGDIASVPPGHDAWVVGNEPVVMVDISGAAEYAKRR